MLTKSMMENTEIDGGQPAPNLSGEQLE